MPNRKREGPDDPHAAALRASEQRYRDLIAILPDALFIQHGGFVTFANDSAAKLFGAAAPGDLIGRSVMSMFDARHHPAIRKRIELLNAGESVPFVEEHIVRLDGSIREVEVAATPYHDPDGMAVQVVLHDVSERRMLERALVEATEREQMRIGVDLHDGLGQELVAVDLALRAIEQRAQAQDGALRDDIGNARRLVARAVASSRSLARSLAPLALPATGLGTALKDLAAQCSTLYGFDCRYEGESATWPSLTPSTATHMFRIAQEATSNAARHAQAHHVQIRLQQLSELLRLDIIDDGAASQRTRLEPSNGIGLKTMEYRARLIGGRLTVQHHHGSGTRVRFEMPQLAVG